MNSVTVHVVLVLGSWIPSAPLWGSQASGSLGGSGSSVILHPVDATTGAVDERTTVSIGLPAFGMFDLAAHFATQGTSVWVVRASGGENDLVAVNPMDKCCFPARCWMHRSRS